MKTPHKHAELIKAWADGAEIECRPITGRPWLTMLDPAWSKYEEYRIKPEPKPDVTKYLFVTTQSCDSVTHNKYSLDNLKLTFDGVTGKLKSAEVI